MRFLIVFIHQTKAIVNKGIVKKGNKGMFEISSKSERVYQRRPDVFIV